ncbi:MAG: thioesterase domain-containing protein, partial [Bacteroidota bacterium]
IEKKSNYNIYEVASYRDYFKDGVWDLQGYIDAFREEIADINSNQKFILYGHCAGTALTMLLAQELQKLNKEILGIFLGASLFQASTNAPFSKDQIRKLLFNINGNLQMLTTKEQEFIIDNFGVDNKIAIQIKNTFDSKRQEVRKLTCPIHCIFGEYDPLTSNYQKEYNSWQVFSEDTLTCDTIADGNHYFVNEKSDMTATIIINKIKDWNENHN